jgi:hypothetical protein
MTRMKKKHLGAALRQKNNCFSVSFALFGFFLFYGLCPRYFEHCMCYGL